MAEQASTSSKTREILSGISKTAQILKLQAEIKLIDRELDAIKSAFGVKLYDAIAGSELPIFLEHISATYDSYREYIEGKQKEMESKFDQIDSHQSERLRSPQPTTASERAQWVTSRLKSRSSDVKLKMEAVMLDRDMNKAKQLFGRQVFAAAMEMAHVEDLQQQPPEGPAAEEEPNTIKALIDEVAGLVAKPQERRGEKSKQLSLLGSSADNDIDASDRSVPVEEIPADDLEQ